MSEKIFLTGLWVHETKDGSKYFSGKLGIGGKVLIFKNTYAEEPNDPQYKMYMVASEKKTDDAPQEPAEDLPF